MRILEFFHEGRAREGRSDGRQKEGIKQKIRTARVCVRREKSDGVAACRRAVDRYFSNILKF